MAAAPATKVSVLWRVWPTAAGLAMCALVFAGHASAQTPQPVQSPGDLKKLSLDELLRIDVTSVSKRGAPMRSMV